MKRLPPILFIALGLFGVYCIEFGVVGILPLIIARFRVTPSEAGLLVGVFALVVAVGGPFLVLLAARFNRKRMLAAALLVFAAVSAASAYAPSFAALLWLRIVPALFHPIYFSLAMVSAVSLYGEQQATQATAHAFIGTSMGMVLGIPLTAWVADRFTYEASFLFCAAVNVVAAIGLIVRLPDAPAAERQSYGSQLAVLRKPSLWLNIGASTMIFAAMFSVYSYAAEFLHQRAGMSGGMISLMLVVFGVGGVLGNLLAGKLLAKSMVSTALMHPVVLVVAYLVLYCFGSPAIGPMIVIALFWGAAHTSGLIVTQIWLTSEAPEAPEFITGVYISFINLGVTIGSLAGGWFIHRYGMQGSIFSGILFAGVAVVLIGLKVMVYGGLPRRDSVPVMAPLDGRSVES